MFRINAKFDGQMPPPGNLSCPRGPGQIGLNFRSFTNIPYLNIH